MALADPPPINAFRTAQGPSAETDRLDAGLIARLAARLSEPLRPAPAPVARKALSPPRRQPTGLIAMGRTRPAQALDPRVADSHRAVIGTREAACAGVETALGQRSAADPALARRRAIRASIPGIGRVLANALIRADKTGPDSGIRA